MSQVFQSGSALLSNGHGHKVSDSTKQKIQTIFDALRANPKIGVQRLEGLLQQIPKVRYIYFFKLLYLVTIQQCFVLLVC